MGFEHRLSALAPDGIEQFESGNQASWQLATQQCSSERASCPCVYVCVCVCVCVCACTGTAERTDELS